MLAGAFIGFGCAVASWRALGTARDPRTGRERGDRDASPELGRARFMALAGVLVSVLFAGGVALFGVSAVLVNACSQAR
jgi:hypothetical protein